MKLKISNALRDGFEMLKTNRTLLVVGLISFVLYSVLDFVLVTNFVYPLKGGTIDVTQIGTAIGSFIIISLLSVFLSGVIISAVVSRKKVSAIQCFQTSARKYLTFLSASILSAVISLVALIALIIPGIYVSIRLLLFEFAIFRDNKNVMDSLRKSWRITKENWWRTFALYLVVTIIIGVISFSLGFVSGSFLVTGTSTIITDVILSFLLWVFLVPWVTATLFSVYTQLDGSRGK